MQRKFEQVDYPQRLWVSKIALCVTGTASRFVTKWLAQHPDQKKNWEVFKATFLKKFSMKDSDVVIMTKLQTFKMTGTICGTLPMVVRNSLSVGQRTITR
ncbi:hypothetical protein DSO57_1018303 [Entomophthora muscae]|uniref:Uncharacterized protein n=1 Tax=Entomophthora muscae TaxID=34485 RepID=A0ACC2UQN5_9FUNG|nr:hypothetical protein DSO57_1018303 [Entomophthora muscae]